MTDHEFLKWLVQRAVDFRSRQFGSDDWEVYRDCFDDAVRAAQMRLKNQKREETRKTLQGES